MGKHRVTGEQKTSSIDKTEVFSWLESLPLAPEYYPTLEEFQDPIAFILKIENEASKYGICKIIPPVSLPSRDTTIKNLNLSLSSQSVSSKAKSCPTFTTREQKVGVCPRRHRPLNKPIRQSGLSYTLPKFEAKAKLFAKKYLNKCSKTVLTPLEFETLYWRATVDKYISVEYASDMPGSAFVPLDEQNRGREEALTVGDTAWNTRGVSRSEGSVLRYVNEDIPGVTSPMVYIGMLFSWFAWHVEDHDLHSLNYMHMGAAKTWYGVPENAAVVFEDMVRSHLYGGETNPILTFATLSKKTTVLSPEVLLNDGVRCCRLVQNAGEFVVTFPRAYHSGFSHGFNCAEATNIATPEWLRLAKGAAIRRASIGLPPLVSHVQLLYTFALSLSARLPTGFTPEPKRHRLTKKSEGESLVKELFVQDVIQNADVLYTLGKGSPIITLPEDFLSISSPTHKTYTGVFSCVACGILCFACVAIIQPSDVAAQNLISADCSNFVGLNVASEVANDHWTRSSGDANSAEMHTNLGWMVDNSSLSLLALNYGDSSDSDEDQAEGHVDASTYRLIDSSTVSIQDRTFPSVSNSDEDSSRLHAFCLQHAVEFEQKLRPFGGAHMLLLCHPEFPELHAEAKLTAVELGSDYFWNDTTFREATDEDKETIESVLNDEDDVHGNGDWAVKLGVDLFDKGNLSHSSVYTNRMAYNSIVDSAVEHNSSDQTAPKLYGEGSVMASDRTPHDKPIQYKRRPKSTVKEMVETPQRQVNTESRKKRAKIVAAVEER